MAVNPCDCVGKAGRIRALGHK